MEQACADLGLLPAQVDRLTVTDVRRLIRGYRWRRSRDVETLSVALSWVLEYLAYIAQSWGAEITPPDSQDIARSFPGYEEGDHGPR